MFAIFTLKSGEAKPLYLEKIAKFRKPYKSMDRFGYWIMLDCRVCQSLEKRANPRTAL